jgi:hypothetical protein
MNHEKDLTGTGTPRSADDGLQQPGVDKDRVDPTDVDESVIVGATTDSHPAEADDVKINRSGSGGTGGPGN